MRLISSDAYKCLQIILKDTRCNNGILGVRFSQLTCVWDDILASRRVEIETSGFKKIVLTDATRFLLVNYVIMFIIIM
jgi:hypothetical protein